MTQAENIDRFIQYMYDNEIQPQDVSVLYGMITSMPNNADIVTQLGIVMNEFGLDAGGQYITGEYRHDLKRIGYRYQYI